MKHAYGNVAAIGMDVHYQFSSVTFRDGQGRIVRHERLEHPDRAALRARLRQWPRGSAVVLEASFGWGWLADELRAAGLRPALSNCFKVEKMRQARGGGKSNRKDSDLLSLLPFEATEWWRVWLAPPGVRDQREWMRYRSDLVELQTGTKNRIHAVFHRHGIFHEFSDLFGVKGREFLGELCRDGGGVLTGGPLTAAVQGGALMALRGQVRLLGHVRGQLAAVTRRLRREMERTPLAQRLDSIPGIGLVLAHTLMAEIGRIERFRSDRGLASYSLLAPISKDTGEPEPGRAPLGRHLGTRGNRTLKWAFIEAAHGAVRRGGRWRAMFDRYTEGGKRNRNKGYIKVARQLVKVVFAVWSKQQRYTDSPPARPGSRRRGRSSRSGTGQPHQPMVVAE